MECRGTQLKFKVLRLILKLTVKQKFLSLTNQKREIVNKTKLMRDCVLMKFIQHTSRRDSLNPLQQIVETRNEKISDGVSYHSELILLCSINLSYYKGMESSPRVSRFMIFMENGTIFLYLFLNMIIE